MVEPQRVLLTGATGFVGRRLYEPLAERYANVRCATRSVESAAGRWPDRDWTFLDVADPDSVARALQGIDVAYYLVHGMGEHEDYERSERAAAECFAREAEAAGVSRIIYLGGVTPSGDASTHLRSRLTTGRILRAGAVPCVELRAGMIIGAGSESWQMVRDLSARLPVMVLPVWMQSRSEPVAIADVLVALVRAAEVAEVNCYSIPGPEVLSAKEILSRVSALRGIRPLTIDVPFVSPRLSSYWIQWVTRANHKVARELVEGLRSDLTADRPPFWKLLPDHELLSFNDAARRALEEEPASMSLGGRVVEALVRTVALKKK